jgi:hypothetical protein
MLARGMHVEDRVNPVKEPYTFSDGFSSRFVWICRVAVFLSVSEQSPLRSKSNGGGVSEIVLIAVTSALLVNGGLSNLPAACLPALRVSIPL